jgi:hypothetical protein
MMVAVNNEGAAPMGRDADDILARYPTGRNFQIPALDPAVARIMAGLGVSLSRFLLAPPTDMPIVTRAELRAWIGRVFAQFNSFEMRRAMDETEYLR